MRHAVREKLRNMSHEAIREIERELRVSVRKAKGGSGLRSWSHH